MAITRKFLKALGLEDEKIDQIIEEHTAITDRMKGEIAQYKTDAEKLSVVQRELDALKEAGDGGLEKKAREWEEKAREWEKKFKDREADDKAREVRAAKEKAVRAYLESKNIKDGNLTIAMRGLSAEVDTAELDGDKLKDTKALDDLIAGDLAGLVTTTREQGAPPPANPPKNTGGAMTREEIYKKDDKGRYVLDATARQKALAQSMSGQT